MRILRFVALVLTAVILSVFILSCSSLPSEPINRPPRKGICAIPGSEEELIKKTDAQKRYADCYLGARESTVVGCFVSPDCAVEIRRLVYTADDDLVTAFVADVYIDSMEQFIGYVCRSGGKLSKLDADAVLADTGALLLINSDFLTARSWGLYMRGGSVIRDSGTEGVDICSIDVDGVMKVYDGDVFDASAAKKDDASYHVFSFGPSLLNDDGSPRDEDGEFHITDKYSKWNNYESSVGFPVTNPRTAIGQAEDGHFVFVTVDGRMWKKRSRGVTFPELSHMMYEEGAVVAYNMDGGGSEIMVYKGEELTMQYSEDAKRIPSDYICITSSYYTYTKNENET